jgi:hypothetical protein
MLDWLFDCTFTNCRFRGIFGLGDAQDVKFSLCASTGKSILSFYDESKNLVFDQCQFTNDNADPNHRGAIFSNGDLYITKCRGKNFTLTGYKKLVLRNFITDGIMKLGTAYPGEFSDKSQMPYSDFLLEDCDFRRGVDMTNAELNNFTLRNCKVGVLKTWHSVIRDSALIEGIKEGFITLASTTITKSLTVRNCSFHKTYEGHSFKCNTDTPVHSLIENIECGSAPADVICSGGPMKESDWLPVASNQSTIIRNCKIPYLKVDWAQTERLRLENCDFDLLYIRNGRIGKLEIINCSLRKLDVTDTQVKTQDVRIPEGGKLTGHVTVTTGSNIKLLPK